MTTQKDNISKFNHCYGCGVCVAACPVKVIELVENGDGFYQPHVAHPDKCIHCGLCLKVCAFNHTDLAESAGSCPKQGWAVHSNNEVVRLHCSSGGIGFEIGKLLLASGFKACGVRYNPEKRRAEHFIADTEEGFRASVGSKYIPSFTAEAFSQINRQEKYLVTGTPCQIDSFRRYIKHYQVEDHFVLLDFFCHGVPSLRLWDKYLSEVEAKIGKVAFVSWRNKTGWQDSWAVCADVEEESLDWHSSYEIIIRSKSHTYQSRLTTGDLFYKYFLGNVCLSECCYKDCKYKMTNSAADIRIGDFWGKTYAAENKGTSAVIAFTQKGADILATLADSACTMRAESVGTVTEGQMSEAPVRPWARGYILRALRGKLALQAITDSWYRLYRISILPRRIFNRLMREIKKCK